MEKPQCRALLEFTGTGTGIARGLGPGMTVRRDLRRCGRSVTHNSAQLFSAEIVGNRLVVLSGQGGVERPDAWRPMHRRGSPPTTGPRAGGARATRMSPTEAAVPESSCLAAERGAERGRGVQRRSLARTASGPVVKGVPAGQCDHFRPPAPPLGQPIPEGRAGLPMGCVRPPTRP